jgi:hypothetical protein
VPHVGSLGRLAFAGCWIAGQIALVLTAPLRADRAFGFRMFPEASTMEIHLVREAGDRRLPVPRGEWIARDGSGQVRSFSWRDRVRDKTLAAVDTTPVFASYGLDAQIARLQRALDDVADHIPGDTETTRLGANVVVRRNGREPSNVTLFSHVRRFP